MSTTGNDRETLLRVRERLELCGHQLELHGDATGWRWWITDRRRLAERRFDSLQLALEHADMYTAIWYDQRDEPTPRDVVSQFEPNPEWSARRAEVAPRTPMAAISRGVASGAQRVAGMIAGLKPPPSIKLTASPSE